MSDTSWQPRVPRVTRLYFELLALLVSIFHCLLIVHGKFLSSFPSVRTGKVSHSVNYF